MIEPKFTDEELERFTKFIRHKAAIRDPDTHVATGVIDDLLARLEAAEAYAEAKVNGSEQMQTLWKAWRKASGK